MTCRWSLIHEQSNKSCCFVCKFRKYQDDKRRLILYTTRCSRHDFYQKLHCLSWLNNFIYLLLVVLLYYTLKLKPWGQCCYYSWTILSLPY